MDEKEKRIIEEEILGKDHAGYAYIYPYNGDRQEYVFDMTPENIANFLGTHQFDAGKIILTDMIDRPILNTIGGFIDQCPDDRQNKSNDYVKCHASYGVRLYHDDAERYLHTVHYFGRCVDLPCYYFVFGVKTIRREGAQKQ